jgi:hypothetical protein
MPLRLSTPFQHVMGPHGELPEASDSQGAVERVSRAATERQPMVAGSVCSQSRPLKLALGSDPEGKRLAFGEEFRLRQESGTDERILIGNSGRRS